MSLTPVPSAVFDVVTVDPFEAIRKNPKHVLIAASLQECYQIVQAYKGKLFSKKPNERSFNLRQSEHALIRIITSLLNSTYIINVSLSDLVPKVPWCVDMKEDGTLIEDQETWNRFASFAADIASRL